MAIATFKNSGVRIDYWDEGSGEPVILLHSSSSSSRQWKKLQQEIGGRYRFLALDLYGYGNTDFPESAEAFVLEQEVSLLERLIARIDGLFHLVGHSYGGAVAMKTALKHRDRVCSLYLHEPVAFSLLKMEGRLDEWHEIRSVAADVATHVAHGRHEDAAARFVDYWGGERTWAAMPDHRKPDLVRTVRKVPLDFDAIFAAKDSLSAYGELRMPIRLTAGNTGPLPARLVAELLSAAFGRDTLYVIDGVGHMAPVTHPQEINAHIISHLEANRIGG